MNSVHQDRVSGLFWLLFAAYVCREGARVGVGYRTDPGPGFLLFWTALLLALLSIIVFAATFRRARADAREEADDTKWVRITAVVIALWAYALLLEPLGFVLDTFLLVAVFLTAAGSVRWFRVVAVALGAALGSYAVFHWWLGVRLPVGVFRFL